MDSIDRAASHVFRFFTYFAIIAQLYIVIITTVNVFSRYFFSTNINGAFETSELAMALISFGALPIVTLFNGHIKVDLIVSRFGTAGQNAMTTVNNVLCAAAMLFIGYYSYEKGLRALAQGISTNSTRILHWPFYMFIALMLVFSALCCIYNVVHLYVTGRPVDDQAFKTLRGRRKTGEKGSDK